MPYLNLFDHLDSILRALKTNLDKGLVDEEIVQQVFQGDEPDYYSQLIEKLYSDGYIARGEKGYRHYWGKSHLLTIKGIGFTDKGGYLGEFERVKVEIESREQIEKLEIEKLNAEVQDLRNRLFDYESMKKRTIRSEWIAWISAIVALLAFLFQFFRA